jgi:hypothetical protein
MRLGNHNSSPRDSRMVAEQEPRLSEHTLNYCYFCHWKNNLAFTGHLLTAHRKNPSSTSTCSGGSHSKLANCVKQLVQGPTTNQLRWPLFSAPERRLGNSRQDSTGVLMRTPYQSVPS